MRRLRSAVLAAAGLVLCAAAPPADKPVLPTYPTVRAGTTIRFPADHGAHADFRTEWWYATGWLRTQDGRDLGFQVTFFRTRPSVDQRNPSAFAPKQIIFAHAALSDPAVGRLLHDQRIARQGFGLAEAKAGDASIVLDDWRLARGSDGAFRAHAGGQAFALDLALAPTQPPLLQGDAGYSRKGPKPTEASYYYSLPHLRVSGAVLERGRRVSVTGEAWLDHEWASTLLDPQAVGWDWLGLNLDDGGALMVFRIRDKAGRTLWTAGELRDRAGHAAPLGNGDIDLTADQVWRSPRTGGLYPVAQTLTVRTPAGPRRFALKPLFVDQELDSRAAGGPVYWEGAVSGPGARGYLELTGYVSALKM